MPESGVQKLFSTLNLAFFMAIPCRCRAQQRPVAVFPPSLTEVVQNVRSFTCVLCVALRHGQACRAHVSCEHRARLHLAGLWDYTAAELQDESKSIEGWRPG